MNYIKTFESYSDIEQYTDEIFTFLRKYNLFPEQERYLRGAYSNEIEKWYNDGKYTREFSEKIAKDLQLSTGGLMQYKMTGGNQWQNIYYK